MKKFFTEYKYGIYYAIIAIIFLLVFAVYLDKDAKIPLWLWILVVTLLAFCSYKGKTYKKDNINSKIKYMEFVRISISAILLMMYYAILGQYSHWFWVGLILYIIVNLATDILVSLEKKKLENKNPKV